MKFENDNVYFYKVRVFKDCLGIEFDLLASDESEVHGKVCDCLTFSDFTIKFLMKLSVPDAIRMFELQKEKKYFQSFQLLDARNLVNEHRTNI